jgi:hypothetical protein
MSPTDATSDLERNPIERLAEEFVERQRRGECPSLTEYVSRYPELAEEIRDLFPALVVVERLKPVARDCYGRAARWMREQNHLDARNARELAGFQQEAKVMLTDLPEDVFAGPH